MFTQFIKNHVPECAFPKKKNHLDLEKDINNKTTKAEITNNSFFCMLIPIFFIL